MAVLQGASRTTTQSRPIIAFEFGSSSYEAYGVDPSDAYSFFEDLDYCVFSILGSKLDRATFVSDSRAQIYWDYIAAPSALAQEVADAFSRIALTDEQVGEGEDKCRYGGA